jgi:pyruvate/2-oxoglutarate dehydrogenase complex dihydrolipoamide acyltransferase (E2) component
MTATPSEAGSGEQVSATTPAPVPKRITNAQTVCNEKNAKGKLCNGHLKQLRTAGEPAEIHLRGDDVLFKCQTCGTLYMGPPLGHVRDPNKQSRFVEAELSALLQAAGGTLPVVKKDARGVFIMETTGHPPAAAKPATAAVPAAPPPVGKTAPAPAPAAKPPAPAAQKPPAPKAGAEPDRKLNKRSTYTGVVDTGPVAGETFEQKVARLRAVAAAAKKRAEEGGEPIAPTGAVPPDSPVVPSVLESAMTPPPKPETSGPAPDVASAPAPSGAATEHKPTGQADRTLMHRSTYCGVVDTGPNPGETFEQKVERLRALAAAAKQRAEGG